MFTRKDRMIEEINATIVTLYTLVEQQEINVHATFNKICNQPNLEVSDRESRAESIEKLSYEIECLHDLQKALNYAVTAQDWLIDQ